MFILTALSAHAQERQQNPFWSEEKCRAQVEELEVDTAAWRILYGAGTNAPTLRTFLEQASNKDISVALLRSLTPADWTDVTLSVLWDSYWASPSVEVLCPRVADEPLRPYKAYIASRVPAMTAPQWLKWVETNIRLDESSNTSSVPMSVSEVFTRRVADKRSLNVFIVAGARALGIPASLNALGMPCFEP